MTARDERAVPVPLLVLLDWRSTMEAAGLVLAEAGPDRSVLASLLAMNVGRMIELIEAIMGDVELVTLGDDEEGHS